MLQSKSHCRCIGDARRCLEHYDRSLTGVSECIRLHDSLSDLLVVDCRLVRTEGIVLACNIQTLHRIIHDLRYPDRMICDSEIRVVQTLCPYAGRADGHDIHGFNVGINEWQGELIGVPHVDAALETHRRRERRGRQGLNEFPTLWVFTAHHNG